MNQKLKPATRLSIVFICIVVLSGSILTWFSINNISNVKKLTENRILEEQRELYNLFLSNLENKLESLALNLKNSVFTVVQLKDSLINKANEYEFLIQPFILDSLGTFLYPNFKGINEKQEGISTSGTFKNNFAQGEKAEFAEHNFLTAGKYYTSSLSNSQTAKDSAKALNALGRIAVKQKNYDDAVKSYASICRKYSGISDENGIPFIYYALPQLMHINGEGYLNEQLAVYESCLEKIKTGNVPLNFATRNWLAEITESVQIKSTIKPDIKEQLKEQVNSILNQIDFVDTFYRDFSGFAQTAESNGSETDFYGYKIYLSNTRDNCEFLLYTKQFGHISGFCADKEKLLNSVILSELQNGFEFEYQLDFPSVYEASPKNSLVFLSPLNPVFPEQMIRMKLRDENLINDLVQRRKWIYGISTILLIMAMILGVVLIVRDINREKNMARLQSDFISNVTHELKTPLTSIYMFAESILLKRLKKESDKEEYLSAILKESERLKRMINNILEFSKNEKGKSDVRFTETNLAQLVKSAIQGMDYWFKNEGFNVKTELDNTIKASVDPEKIKQAIENILTNSVKYSDKTKEIKVSLYSNTEHIHIDFEDRGIGIAENKLEHIFEKFYRIDQKESISGTGLGLTVVKEIIDAHKGRVEVQSEVGKGSKFSIIL